MPKIGYARVSSSSQDLDIQNAKLVAAGCEVIRSETASGASRDDRSELATVMEFLRDGDELVVHRLDRIGRSIRDVLNLVHELDARGASLRVLEPAVTTAGDMGHIVITVLGMVADMELKFIHDRQRAGIEAASRGFKNDRLSGTCRQYDLEPTVASLIKKINASAQPPYSYRCVNMQLRASWANMDGGVVAVRARACSHPGDFSLK